jgi:hypothetical protein
VRLSECIEILARRLRGNRGRIAAIANRLQHAGMIALAEAKKTPPEVSVDEAGWLLIAVLGETGVATAAERARDYGAMTSPEGYRLHEAVAHVLRGHAEAGDVIVKQGGAIATINRVHTVFGQPADDGRARFVTGPTLAAIAAEFTGASPGAADAVAAIMRI